MSINSRKIKIYSEKIQDISCEFVLETELNHLEKEKLLELPNPNRYIHLKDLQINNHDPRRELTVHVIVGIRTTQK